MLRLHVTVCVTLEKGCEQWFEDCKWFEPRRQYHRSVKYDRPGACSIVDDDWRFRQPERKSTLMMTSAQLVDSFSRTRKIILHRLSDSKRSFMFGFNTAPRTWKMWWASSRLTAFKPWYENAYSPYCSPHISDGTSKENLTKYQHISSMVIFFSLFSALECLN